MLVPFVKDHLALEPGARFDCENGAELIYTKGCEFGDALDAPANGSYVPFFDLVVEEDRHRAREIFNNSVGSSEPVDAELRVHSKTLRKLSGPEGEIWVMFMLYPEKDEAGTIKTIMCCATDITQLKAVEAVTIKSRREAEEARRRQERFMDTTSSVYTIMRKALYQSLTREQTRNEESIERHYTVCR